MKKLTNLIIAFSLLNSVNAFAGNYTKQDLNVSKVNQSAAMGGVATGGGDLCEDRIKEVRNDIKAWIDKGGSKALNLPSGILNEKYDRDMLEQIAKAKIRCVGKGDAGYPVEVNEVAKVCRFDRSSSLSLITCDYNKFQKMLESDQYVLVHHEYAGLADIEKPNGSDSDYRVSNQLALSLENFVVKKLVVRKSDGFQKIPSDKFEQYLKAAVIFTENYTQDNNKPALCRRSEITKKEDGCVWYLKGIGNTRGTVEENLGLYKAQSGTIYKSGNRTEIIFENRYQEDRMTTFHFTYENQNLKSLHFRHYSLQEVALGDVSNPVVEKQWVLIGHIEWYVKK